MKKNILYISVVLLSILSFTSCEKETEGISGTVYFDLKGEDVMQVTLNTSYVEPGVVVKYRDVDVTASVVTNGTVDANTVGLYPISYTYTNADGVKITKSRTVIVCDPTVTTDISGDYATVAGTFRRHKTTNAEILYPGFNVTITKIAPGFFKVSDFLGGYYDQRAKYGVAYACSGYVQLKNDNTLTLLSSSILPWGDTLTSIAEASYNPADQSVKWIAEYATYYFFVVIK